MTTRPFLTKPGTYGTLYRFVTTGAPRKVRAS